MYTSCKFKETFKPAGFQPILSHPKANNDPLYEIV